MARDGSGTYTAARSHADDANAGLNMEAVNFQSILDDLAQALTDSLAKDGQTTMTGNVKLGGFKLTNVGSGSVASDGVALSQVQATSFIYWGLTSGTADNYTLSPTPAIAAYASGMLFILEPHVDCNAAPDINISAVGAKNFKKFDGDGAKVNLVAGDMQDNGKVICYYDGTDVVVLNPKFGLTFNQSLTFVAATELTIATGAVTATQTRHTIDTEADAASDDLTTINGLADGEIIILSPVNVARVVTIKDSGNIVLRQGDFVMSNANDRIVFLGDGTNAIEIARSHTEAPAKILISDTTYSNVAAVAINNLDRFQEYEIEIIQLIPATDATDLLMRISQDNGSSYLTTSGDYSFCVQQTVVTGSHFQDNDNAATSLNLNAVVASRHIGNAIGENYNAVVRLHNPSDTAIHKLINYIADYVGDDGNLNNAIGSGRIVSVSAYNGVQLKMSSGNLSARIKVYGIR